MAGASLASVGFSSKRSRVENYDYGRCGWIMDPEGNRIELGEPPEKK